MALNNANRDLSGSGVPKAQPRRWTLSSIRPTSRYYWIRLLLEKPASLISIVFVSILIILAIIAPLVTIHSPTFVDPVVRLQGPSSDHWFGTDTLGRDIFSRTIFGSRISLLVGIGVTLGAGILGSVLGLIAGYYQRVDTALMRVMDGIEAFPGILLAIAIMASLGASARNVIIALIVVFTSNVARLVRSTTLVNKRQLYVDSARAIGMRDWMIMYRYIFMNSLSPLIVQCTFVIALSILAEASLSFLGAGVPPGTPTWGNMVSEGQAYVRRGWWLVIFPGTFLFLTVLAMNLVGDALRDALDPRSRKR